MLLALEQKEWGTLDMNEVNLDAGGLACRG